MVYLPTDRVYLTPKQVESIRAADLDDSELIEEIKQRRYERALNYLDDGDWSINDNQPYVWRRSYDGKKLTYYIARDSYNIIKPKEKSGYWGNGAFNFLLTIYHETKEGYGENILARLQKTRTPRAGVEQYHFKQALWLGKLNPDLLPPKEKRWNENEVPSLEILQQMVKWDDYLQVLVKISPERDTTEYVLEDNFVELNGEMYAIWRVRSMLEFGNQEGYITNDRWKELLEKHPKSTTPLLPPSLADNQSAPSFKYRSRIKRRDLVIPPLRGQTQEEEHREPKRREDYIHDARVVAARAGKANFGIRRKKKDE